MVSNLIARKRKAHEVDVEDIKRGIPAVLRRRPIRAILEGVPARIYVSLFRQRASNTQVTMSPREIQPLFGILIGMGLFSNAKIKKL
ncbi:hypothetical protein NQ318_002328 [Aromia moschata]|uniref:Uncharacterized protein n=1 Tax=Aromia moschata TaxID=1265417 RepID=A0AAV8Z3L3_9CUCU|nr:hypothetical protein NQ318_002328 [Aromia moschata]